MPEFQKARKILMNSYRRVVEFFKQKFPDFLAKQQGNILYRRFSEPNLLQFIRRSFKIQKTKADVTKAQNPIITQI